MVCFIFYFSALQISLTLFSIIFFFKNGSTFILFFHLVLYLWLVGSLEASKILLARGTACIFSRLCSISTVVCSKFYFSALQISLTLLGIAFFKNILTFFLENAILPCNHSLWNRSRKHGHCYSLESSNVNLLCSPFHSFFIYKHTQYKYFPRCGEDYEVVTSEEQFSHT